MNPRTLLAPLLLIAAAGCGGGPATGPVSGLVTLNGKPLPNARVAFQPTGDDPLQLPPGSVGDTDAEGRYTLRMLRGRGPGAAIGAHRVTITASDRPAPVSTGEEVAEAPGTAPKELVPDHYNAEESGLTFAVPAGGTAEANFELKSP